MYYTILDAVRAILTSFVQDPAKSNLNDYLLFTPKEENSLSSSGVQNPIFNKLRNYCEHFWKICTYSMQEEQIAPNRQKYTPASTCLPGADLFPQA